VETTSTPAFLTLSSRPPGIGLAAADGDAAAEQLQVFGGAVCGDGCQAVITKPGKVVVEIPAWNRNYVSEGH